MPLFEWNASFSVGNESIDLQHRKLVDLINRLHEKKESGDTVSHLDAVFSELEDYVFTHFSYEEKLLEECAYPNLSKHKDEHLKFSDRLSTLRAQYQRQPNSPSVTTNVLYYLKVWLTNHILREDKQYMPYLKSARPPRLAKTAAGV